MKDDIKKLRTRLRKEVRVLAKDRDRLRSIIDDAEMLEENISEAIENIESAVDKLSELV